MASRRAVLRTALVALVALVSLSPAMVLPVRAGGDADGDRLRDTFELDRSHTDPGAADTDADGTPDGAEDPDGDGVTSLWEQRLGLDPLAAGSDADGVSDGREDPDADLLRTLFEIRGGVSDPRYRDSDGNGLPDSAEDPDADRLANLGEQRFGTSPGVTDTNANGTGDGMDDANGNDVRDGVEQDRNRPVPADLVPSLESADGDRPVSYGDGCHVGNWEEEFRTCEYGVPNGSRRIALFGDSHAAHWLPALIRLAEQRGWTIHSLTRSGCPSAQVRIWSYNEGGLDTRCAEYRRRAVELLNANPPDLVIVSNARGRTLYRPDGTPIPENRREARWGKGIADTLANLPPSSLAMVVADTPDTGINAPQCLAANPSSMAACGRTRSKAVSAEHNAFEAAAAAEQGGFFADLTRVTCPYDPCPVVAGNVLMFRDHGHMSATFSRLIAPSLAAEIKAVLGGG